MSYANFTNLLCTNICDWNDQTLHLKDLNIPMHQRKKEKKKTKKHAAPSDGRINRDQKVHRPSSRKCSRYRCTMAHCCISKEYTVFIRGLQQRDVNCAHKSGLYVASRRNTLPFFVFALGARSSPFIQPFTYAGAIHSLRAARRVF